MKTLLLSHAAVTWALVGVIWTVQIVLYPLFLQVSSTDFREYHERHMRRITCIVMPLVLMEFATIALLLRGARDPWLLTSLVPLASNGISTWLVQVPLHLRLSRGFDAVVYRQLVASNWVRTIGWTIRGVCLVCALR